MLKINTLQVSNCRTCLSKKYVVQIIVQFFLAKIEHKNFAKKFATFFAKNCTEIVQKIEQKIVQKNHSLA